MSCGGVRDDIQRRTVSFLDALGVRSKVLSSLVRVCVCVATYPGTHRGGPEQPQVSSRLQAPLALGDAHGVGLWSVPLPVVFPVNGVRLVASPPLVCEAAVVADAPHGEAFLRHEKKRVRRGFFMHVWFRGCPAVARTMPVQATIS